MTVSHYFNNFPTCLQLKAGKMPNPIFDITYATLPQGLFTTYQPAPVPDLKPVLTNHTLANKLELGADWLGTDNALTFFSAQTPSHFSPIAMAYSGHQFGGFSPRLGDGRAALIGEYVDTNGIRHDIHLKGSGRTPYSRGGDGKATLRAVLKEYIFSESLAALGIPTTRSLAALTTGETVMRQKRHPGAILVRTAKSHIRVGTFQFARLMQDETALKTLADYTIERLYPDIESTNPYIQLLSHTIDKQAKLVAKWMSFGFIHGVMNTDNMAISGETIDFGPCAFMEIFRANQVFSSIDHYGRYAWNKQPEMALWNLTRFAESLLPLLDKDEDKAVKIAETELGKFSDTFSQEFNALMRAKLGLDDNAKPDIINETFALLSNHGLDFTLFFRRLTEIASGKSERAFQGLFAESSAGETWLKLWREAAGGRLALNNMKALNPVYIPRFTQVETALEAAEQEDMAPFNKLLTAVTNPFTENPDFTDLAQPTSDPNIPQQTFCET